MNTLETDLDVLKKHIRKMLYAPSGEPICSCRTAAERAQRLCWYCQSWCLLSDQAPEAGEERCTDSGGSS